ncbi:MAG: M20/M25/M40 family metallo-hydrolase [Candidatus Kapabacteria bacterium]|nr:M20/M25/M40 family metallo-hydrolase [Candidatus Kapabacteria bacterium]
MKIYFLLLSIICATFFEMAAMAKSPIDSNYIIKNYSEISKKIIEAVMSHEGSWDRLAYMCDTYGPRLAGSEGLNQALNWAFEEMKKDKLDNVRTEEVMVPHWQRGNEFCELLIPRKTNIRMCALGGSVATPKDGITAPVVVFHSFDELKANPEKAKGKIVLFQYKYENYGQAVQFRVRGASEAARAGAVASIIRSVTPESMKNPHTGVMFYNDSIPKIPHAAIPGEDADMLERMYNRGQNPTVHLYMEAETLPDAPSMNVMGEITGNNLKDEIVALGGHSDCWDLGLGAQDDGSGMVACWEAVKILKNMGLKASRTLRAVLWVNEENGTRGGKKYAELHKDEKHALVFEMDIGAYPPEKIAFTGTDEIFDILKGLEPLVKSLGNIKVTKGGGGVDIGPMMHDNGTYGMSINTDDKGDYFRHHHSITDTPDKVNPEDFKKCIAVIAVAVYIYADLPIDLVTHPTLHNSK